MHLVVLLTISVILCVSIAASIDILLCFCCQPKQILILMLSSLTAFNRKYLSKCMLVLRRKHSFISEEVKDGCVRPAAAVLTDHKIHVYVSLVTFILFLVISCVFPSVLRS